MINPLTGREEKFTHPQGGRNSRLPWRPRRRRNSLTRREEKFTDPEGGEIHTREGGENHRSQEKLLPLKFSSSGSVEFLYPPPSGNLSYLFISAFFLGFPGEAGIFSWVREFLHPFREFMIQGFSHSGNFSLGREFLLPSGQEIPPTLYEFVIQGISLPSGSGNFSSPPGRKFLLPYMNLSFREFLIQGISDSGNLSFREFIIQGICHSWNLSFMEFL